MNKIITTLLLAFILTSCSSGGPKSAAKNFTENMSKGKIEEAKKYATESTGKLLDFASSLGSVPIEPDFKFEFVKDSIVDNRAWVTFINEKGKESDCELVKIDGEWLVHIESKK